MEDIFVDQWEKSYERNENNILYPQTEVVKFLNRFVRKKLSLEGKFIDLIDFNSRVKGLDFGCGVARSAILMEEFGIEAYGCDISSIAIEKAKQNAIAYGFEDLSSRLQTIDSSRLPYDDKFFDISIAESCLDSMFFDNALELIGDISRVTNKYLYLSLISKDANSKTGLAEDRVVDTEHEKGTIQSYYDEGRIHKLISNIDCNIVFQRKISEQGISDGYIDSRYYIVLELI